MKDTNRNRRGGALRGIAADRQEMEMTPMIDVTFLLLIFFMCTLQFRTLEGSLQTYLPKDAGTGSSRTPEIETLRIELRVLEPGTPVRFDPELRRERPVTAAELADGRRFSHGDDRVIEYTLGSTAATDLRSVLETVARIDAAERAAGAPEGPVVEIDARPGTTYGDVAPVIDGVRGLGIGEIRMTGSREL